jgi:hypothetical protein
VIPVQGSRSKTSLTTSKTKKARIFADTEGKYLTPDEESAVEHTRRNVNKLNSYVSLQSGATATS